MIFAKRRRRPSRQQVAKHISGKCFLCGEPSYPLLDAHRLLPGGKYIPKNIIVLCSNCHRRAHAGEVVFDQRKYTNTIGQTVIHYFDKGREVWRPDGWRP